jgi:hypothetical protein
LEEELSSERILSRKAELDSLETSPGDTDLASNLVLQTSKSIFDGAELDRGRGRSLESSGMVVLVGWGRRARDTSSEFTALILDWVEAVLHVNGSHREEESKAYIAYTLVSVLDV